MILRGEEHADLTPAAEIMVAIWKLLNAARGIHEEVDLRAFVAELKRQHDLLVRLGVAGSPASYALAAKRLTGSLELAEAALKFIEAWERTELGWRPRC